MTPSPNNPAARAITADEQPVLGCWIWHASQRDWHRYLFQLTEPVRGMNDCGYTHWAPDQPSPPTVAPETDQRPPHWPNYLRDPKPEDWPEDARNDTDNGCYQRCCVQCRVPFIGNKRRQVCRVCATPSTPASGEGKPQRLTVLTSTSNTLVPASRATPTPSAVSAEALAAAREIAIWGVGPEPASATVEELARIICKAYAAKIKQLEQAHLDAIDEIAAQANIMQARRVEHAAEVAALRAELGSLHGRIGLFAEKWWFINNNLPTDETFKQIEHEIADTANKYFTLMTERDQLAAWKQSALAVESQWDCQAVGRLLNLTLGSDIRSQIEPGIVRLKERVAALEKDGERLDWLAQQAEFGELNLPTFRLKLYCYGSHFRAAIDSARAGGAG